MSASSSPTASPRAAIAAARLTVIEDFPTPPLPEATAYTRVRLPGLLNTISRVGPRKDSRKVVRCSSFMTSNCTDTPVTPGTLLTAAVTRSTISVRMGHPLTVSSTVTATRPSAAMSTDATMPNSVIGRRISGSSTPARAC